MTSSRTRQHRGTVVAAGVTTLVVAGAMLVTVADQGVAVTAQVAHGGKDPTLSPRLAALAALAASSAPGASAQRLNSLGLASEGPGSLIRSGRNSVLVDIRAAGSTSAVVREVAAVGGSVVHVAEQYGVVTASIPVEAAPVVAHSGVALHVSEEVTPVTGSGAAASAVPAVGTPAPCGSATSEGDAQLKADQARAYWNLDGTGVSVGILSDSYDKDPTAVTHAAQDVTSGDLPGVGNPCGRTTPVQVLDDSSSGEDEGRGMLQLVHDVAPGASLKFATAFTGYYAMADNIRALKTAGSNVIADDIFYYVDPFFQQGPVSVAIDDITAQGGHYFTLGGNHNTIVGAHDVSAWESPAYRPTPCRSSVVTWAAPQVVDCENYSPNGTDAGRTFTLANGGIVTLDLQWAQPWFGVTTDLDLLLVDHASGTILTDSADTNSTSGTPSEYFRYQNTSGSAQVLDIVVVRYSGSAKPRLKVAMMQPTNGISAIDFPVSAGGDIVGPTIYGHSGDTNAITLAAVPYNDSAHPETYSSRGPMVTYFGPVTGNTPAAALASPVSIAKPDVGATDGGRTTFFGQLINGAYRFYGTSAATPHAAGVAALILERGSLTQAQLKGLLRSRATAMPLAPPNSVGTGLINARDALAIAPTAPQSVTRVAGNKAATVRWTAPALSGGAPISRYVATAVPGGRTCVATLLAPRSCVVTGLVPGTTYRFSVRAFSIGGGSPASANSAPLVAATVPGPVRLPRVTFPAAGRAQLSWSGPAATGFRPVTGYQFCVTTCALPSGWRSTGATARGPVASLAMSRLAARHVYTVYVRASNEVGSGPALAVRFTQGR